MYIIREFGENRDRISLGSIGLRFLHHRSLRSLFHEAKPPSSRSPAWSDAICWRELCRSTALRHPDSYEGQHKPLEKRGLGSEIRTHFKRFSYISQFLHPAFGNGFFGLLCLIRSVSHLILDLRQVALPIDIDRIVLSYGSLVQYH